MEAVVKVERDIIVRFTSRLIGLAAIQVIKYISTVITAVVLFVSESVC